MNIITIDGPSGSGKSTVSRLLAEKLGYTYLDTGAMYRAVGWQAKHSGIDLDNIDEEKLTALLTDLHLEMKPGQEDVQIAINGHDVSQVIRSAEMGMVASRVSALPAVRQKLTELQREIGQNGKLVAEGRDMGTVVFPEADYKFFLSASAQERARRRVLQLQEKGEEANEDEILAQINQRDTADAGRSLAPLRPAPKAIVIDSSHITAFQVIKIITDELAKK